MRKIKKATSVLLSALLAFSMTAASFDSVSAAIDENGCYYPGDNVEDTYRYYFAMPNSWLNEYTDTAGVYWWSGIDACGAVDGSGGTVTWPGYKAQRDGFVTEYNSVYYIDCPADVCTIIWNNYIDGGTDKDAPVYLKAKQAKDTSVEFCSDGDSDIYDTEWFAEMEESYNGDKSLLGEYVDNFFYDDEYDCGFSFVYDNMIYVLNPDEISESFDGKEIYGGDWYFYYGNGQYGTYPTIDIAEENNTLYSLDDPTFIDTPDVPEPVYPDDDEGQIHFDVKKSGWNLNTNKTFYCHIWKCDGSGTSSGTDWPAWQSRKERCDFNTETGIATFDLAKTGHNFDVSDGAVYCVIFSSNTGMQTYNTIMSGACIGDTMYCNDEQIENPEDSESKCMVAVWENNPECGPEKKITSTGNIVGTAYPEGVTDETLLADFLLRYYDDPAKTDLTQSLLDTLNVSPDDVMDVVYERADDYRQIDTIYDILLNGSDSNESYYNGFFYYKNNDRTAVITGCDGDEEELVIPRTIQGYKVKSIDYFAFEDCTALKSVTISNGITDIYDYAFVNCNNLKSVTIPSSVTEIGLYAFGFRKSKYTNDYIKIDGFTIKGVKGSVAEEYANEVGFEFVAVEEDIFGDVDGNGVLSVADATLIQKYSAELTVFTDSQIKVADVNGDGTVNVLDATAVQQMLVGNAV
ncbi:MAG: leucine-rich repeat protein [Ruminococcus sp.]